MKRTNHLKACLSIFRIQLAQSLQYRLAGLSSASISIFWALIEIVVFTVFYEHAQGSAARMNGLSLSQVISYVWIAQFLVPLQPMSVDGDILSQITSGNVGIALCRPLSLYWQWFAHTAAGRLGGFWMRGILTVLAGFLIPGSMRLSPPSSFAGLWMFIFSAAGAFLLCTAYGMLITAVRLNITWGEGPTYMLLLISGVLSGGYLPLQLWPDALQKLLLYQPFAGYLDIPVRLYVGSMSWTQGIGAFFIQLSWTLAFILAGKALMGHKLKTLIVQGG
jgi:ABC-2 type transport system permease protein